MSEDGILYGNDIRQRLINGANKLLTDAVASTLGPRGQNVILYKRGADPVITKDGVTVARVVELDDDYEQAAVEVLRQAALETERDQRRWHNHQHGFSSGYFSSSQQTHRRRRFLYGY